MPISRPRRTRHRSSVAQILAEHRQRLIDANHDRLQLVVEASARLHGFSLWESSLGWTAEQAQGANPEPVHHAGPSRQATSGCTSDRP